MCNPHLLWFPLTARLLFISHLSILIFHLSSLIFHLSLKAPAFCVWLTVQNYIKNQCHPENPSIILLSVNCPSFRYFFPSNLRQNRPLHIAPPCSVGFCNPTALNISICNAATILVRILRHLWLYMNQGTLVFFLNQRADPWSMWMRIKRTVPVIPI